jgi:hypothetical protein
MTTIVPPGFGGSYARDEADVLRVIIPCPLGITFEPGPDLLAGAIEALQRVVGRHR